MGRKKFLIGGIVILIAIGSLSFMAFRGAATYYYTVSQVLAKESALSGQNIRVAGQVAVNSVVPDSTNNSSLSFVLLDTADTGQSLAVRFKGAVPDAFKAGNDAVVEGHISSPGVFEANQIIAKCPSKYEPKQQ